MDNNTNNIAYELFRQWTKNISIDYPDFDFRIVDERILINDLENSLDSALNSLLKSEKAEKRSMPGYDYGFIVGFIQGKLNAHWGFEYITKQSKEFKNFLINKALFEYLQFETITAIKVKAVYEQMYDDTLNLESLNYELPKKNITDYNIDQLHVESFSGEGNNPVLVFLKNQNSELLLNLLKIEINNYLPDLDFFFDREYVRKLIYNKENQKNVSLR